MGVADGAQSILRIDRLLWLLKVVRDFVQAEKYETQAIGMSGVRNPLGTELTERLTLYREHKPYRDLPVTASLSSPASRQ